jgi:hypothetical protein
MKSKAVLLGAGLLSVIVAGVVGAHDRDGGKFRVATALRPSEEVPAVSSVAKGFFKATIDTNNETITYELTYDGLEGTPAQAHIHVGQTSVNGAISVYLCTNLALPVVTPAIPQPPPCPAPPATVTGTLTAANVIALATPQPQGIDAGEFDELAKAIRKGLAYANVHSSRFPGGEVRGQIDDISRK